MLLFTSKITWITDCLNYCCLCFGNYRETYTERSLQLYLWDFQEYQTKFGWRHSYNKLCCCQSPERTKDY